MGYFGHIGVVERELTVDDAVESDSQCPNITLDSTEAFLASSAPFSDHFRPQKVETALSEMQLIFIWSLQILVFYFLVNDLAYSEITDDHSEVSFQQNVLWLDILMNYAIFMEIIQTINTFSEDLSCDMFTKILSIHEILIGSESFGIDKMMLLFFPTHDTSQLGILHNQIDLLLIGIINHFHQINDMRMIESLHDGYFHSDIFQCILHDSVSICLLFEHQLFLQFGLSIDFDSIFGGTISSASQFDFGLCSSSQISLVRVLIDYLMSTLCFPFEQSTGLSNTLLFIRDFPATGIIRRWSHSRMSQRITGCQIHMLKSMQLTQTRLIWIYIRQH